jgi:hypothetical protein
VPFDKTEKRITGDIRILGVDSNVGGREGVLVDVEIDDKGVARSRLVTILSVAEAVLGDVAQDCTVGRIYYLNISALGNLGQRTRDSPVSDISASGR